MRPSSLRYCFLALGREGTDGVRFTTVHTILCRTGIWLHQVTKSGSTAGVPSSVPSIAVWEEQCLYTGLEPHFGHIFMVCFARIKWNKIKGPKVAKSLPSFLSRDNFWSLSRRQIFRLWRRKLLFIPWASPIYVNFNWNLTALAQAGPKPYQSAQALKSLFVIFMIFIFQANV